MFEDITLIVLSYSMSIAMQYLYYKQEQDLK